jgi:hypothetical protein
MNQEEYPNLSCKSVQARLATQWGYVKAREWVELTDDDIWEVFKEHDPLQYMEFSRAIEAKLREKNS